MRDYLVGSVSDTVGDLATRKWLAACEQTIRTTCQTLGDSSASDLVAASVTLAEGPGGGVAQLFDLIEELADEYGLDVSLKVGQGSATARFTAARAIT